MAFQEAREMDVRDTKGEEGSTDHFEDFSTAGEAHFFPVREHHSAMIALLSLWACWCVI